MNAAELPAPQLGRILIAAGLLSEEQLAQALEEQAQTGSRLGEIIVQRGFISGPALANALAEQHGGVLKTEYGFASGLGGVVARRAAAEAGIPLSSLRPPDPTPMPTLRTAEPQGSPESPVQEGTPEPPVVEAAPDPEPEQSSEPPPLLRPAEPPAPAIQEPAEEPAPPPAAVSHLSPVVPEAEESAPSEVPFQPERATEAPELRIEAEPTPPRKEDEPLPEPVTLHAPDPVAEVQQAPPPEPESVEAPEPEPTPPVESAEPIPVPVELRPPAPEEPQPETSQPAVVASPEPDFVAPREAVPTAPSEEIAPDPVELGPPDPEPVEEIAQTVHPVVPEVEQTPPREVVERIPEPHVEISPPEQPAVTARDDRDELIESLRARVEAQETELTSLREQLEQERAGKDVQVHVWPEEQPVATPPGPVQTEQYLLCVPTTAGYVLLDRVGALPRVGEPVEVPEEEGRFTVTKVVRLPRNGRPCAYLQRA